MKTPDKSFYLKALYLCQESISVQLSTHPGMCFLVKYDLMTLGRIHADYMLPEVTEEINVVGGFLSLLFAYYYI